MYNRLLPVTAVFAHFARVGAIHGDKLLVQQFICLHMTELRVDESVNIIFFHMLYIPQVQGGTCLFREQIL